MKEIFTPKMFINYIASKQDIALEDIGVKPTVVLSWRLEVTKSLAKTAQSKLSKNWIYGQRYPLYAGEIQGNPVCFINVPLGAPGTVMIMEELIACGASVFLGLGWAGSLQQKAPAGTFLVPTSCISEEGTSAHYIDSSTATHPSTCLVKLIQEVCQRKNQKVLFGTIWTTDAPYRELETKIDSYSKKGVLGVDMETSAMYALGQFRKVEVCNLLVVSDELWHEWRPAFFSTEFREGIRMAIDVIRDCLLEGLK